MRLVVGLRFGVDLMFAIVVCLCCDFDAVCVVWYGCLLWRICLLVVGLFSLFMMLC